MEKEQPDQTDWRPFYVQLHERILVRIANGEFGPGGVLPSMRILAEGDSVTSGTAIRIHQRLQDDKVCVPIPGGRGLRVGGEEGLVRAADTVQKIFSSEAENILARVKPYENRVKVLDEIVRVLQPGLSDEK